jgi:hypothetical protein
MLQKIYVGPPCDPNEGKSVAALLAVNTTLEQKIDNMVLEGDSLAMALRLRIQPVYYRLEDIHQALGHLCLV